MFHTCSYAASTTLSDVFDLRHILNLKEIVVLPWILLPHHQNSLSLVSFPMVDCSKERSQCPALHLSAWSPEGHSCPAGSR